MEPTKEKVKGYFMPAKKSSLSGRENGNVDEWEVRPGGMLVQMRNSESNQNSVPVSMIRVRVKYGSLYHDIRISPQASFGDLKKMVAECTGVHHLDQKLIYKKRERDSKAFLDVARVRDGSKIVLIEDIASRERRCLEMLKLAKMEKASKLLQEISLEVDKLGEKVAALEAATSRGEKVAGLDVDNLTAILMNKLVALDGMVVVDSNLKAQKQMQERRVQGHIEVLDMLKLSKSKDSCNGGQTPLRQMENPSGQMPGRVKTQPVQSKHRDATVEKPMQQQQQQQPRPSRHTKPVVVTTQWETFD
ncbi:hypothetical protein Tsubulata_021707 [Turnera subulata]|uniref:Ubiquitin-like domain-containing protein n=1 Tax=Turnera subulata TaxID=218843 RepID=A0A9Q0FQD6_9ROSI|nr:hypothetical protein Tsubulata_021707 [Turnera subulata]